MKLNFLKVHHFLHLDHYINQTLIKSTPLTWMQL